MKIKWKQQDQIYAFKRKWDLVPEWEARNEAADAEYKMRYQAAKEMFRLKREQKEREEGERKQNET